MRALKVLCWGMLLGVFQASAATGQEPRPLSATDRQALNRELATLKAALGALGERPAGEVADAALFHKATTWAIEFDKQFTPADVALMHKALDRGRQRSEMLAAGKKPWVAHRGKLVLAHVSRVDGSVQPYGLVIPANYEPDQPMRLDVVLHGSMQPAGISELRFIARFDEGDESTEAASEQSFIELHPLGRVENAYRWAGETDVLEAIEDACRRYAIDRRRIVLRGMSMGASGTWHLGLKRPDLFAALGPYCGYVDTHQFSETPLATFVKVGPLPEHQERGLRLLDSIDYAANAGVVPVVACMGEKDVFFQAHELMAEAMRREGLTLTNLIAKGTGHVQDPATHAEQMRRLAEPVARVGQRPSELRFVTRSLKYSRCHWLQVLGLERHYARAELAARLRDDVLEIDAPQNLTRFAVLLPLLPTIPRRISVGGSELERLALIKADSTGIVIAREDGKWQIAGEVGRVPLSGKRPGLQGPIDDAFTSSFLCVRGTGQPWHPGVQAYSDASLARFADEWQRYFRGRLPVKDDTAVTEEDLKNHNLILFGDPGSNRWIAQALPHLPLDWTRETVRLGGKAYAADRHLPALIVPSPLAGGTDRYVVLNSGHTFRGADLSTLNYLLFPRWGDWALLKIDPQRPPTAPAEEEVIRAGYFDENWQ